MFGKLFDKLKDGLSKTRNGLTDKINEALKLVRRDFNNFWYWYGYNYGNHRKAKRED